MKLQQLQYFQTLLVIITMVLISVSVLWSWKDINKTLDVEVFSRQVEENINTLSNHLLTLERKKRGKTKDHSVWIDHHKKLNTILLNAPDFPALQKIHLQSLISLNENNEILHQHLYRLIHETVDPDPEIIFHLESKLQSQIEAIREDIEVISVYARTSIEKTARLHFYGVAFIAFCSGVFLFLYSLFIISTTKKSLTAFKYGAEELASGDLDYQIPEQKLQEFNIYAKQFNSMAKKLRQSTVTEEELQVIVAEKTQALEDLANTDALTGIANRRYLFDRGRIEYSSSVRHLNPLSILMFDIDLFKNVNDSYGHEMGDNVLIHLCDRCNEVVRTGDVFARYGGEEFCILLPMTTKSGAVDFAKRLLSIIRDNQFEIKDEKIQLTISIGIASKDVSCRNLDDLVNNADKALYIAKKNGRDQFQIYGISSTDK